jgi:hypothetical protein
LVDNKNYVDVNGAKRQGFHFDPTLILENKIVLNFFIGALKIGIDHTAVIYTRRSQIGITSKDSVDVLLVSHMMPLVPYIYSIVYCLESSIPLTYEIRQSQISEYKKEFVF